jgi:hypothetical protein
MKSSLNQVDRSDFVVRSKHLLVVITAALAENLAIMASATFFGVSAYLANSMEKVARPCDMERMSVA